MPEVAKPNPYDIMEEAGGDIPPDAEEIVSRAQDRERFNSKDKPDTGPRADIAG